MRLRSCLTTLLLLGTVTCSHAEDANWPQWRGPNADGVTPDNDDLPTTWTTTENVKWIADVPGWGWSCPVVWGDRVFLSTVVSDEQNLAPSKGLYLGEGVRNPAKGVHHWIVACFDLNSGKSLWQKEAHVGRPQVPRHPKSTYAAETACTDGKRLYVLFGDLGLYACDFDGELIWSKQIEPKRTAQDYGAAASPVVHDDQVFVVYDNLESSWIASFDAQTGEQRWRTQRDETHSWATPYIWQHATRTEIVVPGKRRNRSYSLDGKVLWEFDGRMSNLVIPSPFAAHGMCYIASGYVGDRHRPTFAVKPGASGDITPDGEFEESKFIAWYQGTSSSYNPSQIVYGDYLYTLYDRGFLTCHDAKTGKEIYGKQRFTPRGSFTASPWAYNGHLFFLSEEGLTYVVKAGPKFEIIARNDLAELCIACPAAVDNKLLVRTASKLYCMTKGAKLDPAVTAKMKPRRQATEAIDLWSAARDGKLNQINQVLASGTSVNARQGGRGLTALNTAVLHGQVAATKLLLDKGADVSLANPDGNTALHMAAFFGDREIVAMLLAKGASPSVKNKQGDTPIKSVSSEWTPQLESIYKSIGQSIAREFDSETIKSTRPKILAMLNEAAGDAQKASTDDQRQKKPEKASRMTVERLPDAITAKTKSLNTDFFVALPEDYEATKPSPLLIFLHGRGERGTDINRVARHGPPKLIRAGESFPFIVVSPQCLVGDDGRGWWNNDDLDLLLKHVIDTYKVDSKRIYLTGLSMGGFGTWSWSVARPHTFAAIAPICGGGDPQKAESIAHLPAWVFHGAKDSVVPATKSEEMIEALKEHGSKVKLTIYPDANHDSWTKTYANQQLYTWLLEQKLANPKSAPDKS